MWKLITLAKKKRTEVRKKAETEKRGNQLGPSKGEKERRRTVAEIAFYFFMDPSPVGLSVRLHFSPLTGAGLLPKKEPSLVCGAHTCFVYSCDFFFSLVPLG